MTRGVQRSDVQDNVEFFDCAETQAELSAIRNGWSLYESRDCDYFNRRECMDMSAASAVLRRTREKWEMRMKELRREGAELEAKAKATWEWATPGTARRMLKANGGKSTDIQKAVDMFVQALEMRFKNDKLYRTMECQPKSDIRVIGRDTHNRPAVYMCAKSQTAPTRELHDQIVVTLEAACKLTSEEGTVVFVIDMFGFRPQLNCDFAAIKDLGTMLGTVYAERICRIMIVDFSRAAQTLWWLLKPILSPATRQKVAFVGESRARSLLLEEFGEVDRERICETFSVNRDPTRTMEDRAMHARRTTLCDVPLGPPL